MKRHLKQTEKTLDEILEICLADIRAGADQNECLSRYPGQAHELEPLLRVASILREAPAPGFSEPRMMAGRQRLLQGFITTRERAPWQLALFRLFSAPAFALSTVLTVIAAAFFGARVYLAPTPEVQPTVSVYPNVVETQPVTPVETPTIQLNGIGLPDGKSGPYQIASAPDGNLWFARYDATQIGSVNSEDGEVRDWEVSSGNGRAAGIAVDRDGRVWFTVSSSQSVVALDTKTNNKSTWRLTTDDGTLGRIIIGEGQRVWFIARGGDQIYSLDPESGKFTGYAVHGAQYLEWGGDSLWFSGTEGNLGRIASDGTVTIYEVPGRPAAMVWDQDALWYAGGSLIGRFDPLSGAVVAYPLDAETPADRIAADGLNNFWFGARGGAQLGVLQAASGQMSVRDLSTVTQTLNWLEMGVGKIWLSGEDGSFVYSLSLLDAGAAGVHPLEALAALAGLQ